MKVTWKITKKRGNWRPVLEWFITLEEWEKELRPYIPYIKTNIPDPELEDFQAVRGKEADPDWKPKGYHVLRKTDAGKLTLPWRPGANPEYPEVQEAMTLLRDVVEAAIIEAHDSLALETSGALEMSYQGKRHVAAYVAARKMLAQDQEPKT